MTKPTALDIEALDLVTRLEQLPRDAIDSLPFGVVQLDAAGNVIYFSRTEAQQSGLSGSKAMGKRFFTELAPCMGTSEFLQRIERAVVARTLDITFESVGDFNDAD